MCVYEVIDSESALELNLEVVTLTPGTPCITVTIFVQVYRPLPPSGNTFAVDKKNDYISYLTMCMAALVK